MDIVRYRSKARTARSAPPAQAIQPLPPPQPPRPLGPGDRGAFRYDSSLAPPSRRFSRLRYTRWSSTGPDNARSHPQQELHTCGMDTVEAGPRQVFVQHHCLFRISRQPTARNQSGSRQRSAATSARSAPSSRSNTLPPGCALDRCDSHTRGEEHCGHAGSCAARAPSETGSFDTASAGHTHTPSVPLVLPTRPVTAPTPQSTRPR